MEEEPILEVLSFSFENNLNCTKKEDASTDAVSKDAPENIPSTVLLGESGKTPCLIPKCDYVNEPVSNSNPESKSALLQHFLVAHKFVIDSVDEIASLHKYVIYWKQKFEDTREPLKEFCAIFEMGDVPKPGKDKKSVQDSVKTYYMIPKNLPEDEALRKRLWNERLEIVLEVNKREREERNFQRKCLFCREVHQLNRRKLFEHMKSAHSFNVGHEDNIVFVHEFFDLIEDKLNKLICIYCDKVFKDKTVLREHMRKKQHKQLNPDNSEFDRFYLVNYLEAGKSWKSQEDDPEDMKHEEDWAEFKDEVANIVCLLCTKDFIQFEDVGNHMSTEHKFDFDKLVSDMEFYDKVKVVNYIRRKVYQGFCIYCNNRFLEKTELLNHMSSLKCCDESVYSTLLSKKPWNQAEYLFPTYENDQFLMHLDDNDDEDNAVNSHVTGEPQKSSVKVIPEMLTSEMFADVSGDESMSDAD